MRKKNNKKIQFNKLVYHILQIKCRGILFVFACKKWFMRRKDDQNTLVNKNFLTIFSHWEKTLELQNGDFGNFLNKYKYDEKILGRQYFIFRAFSNFLRKLRRTLRIFGKFFWYVSGRLVVIGMIAAIVYWSTPQTIGAPQSITISAKTQWEEGTLSDISATSEEDAIQLRSDGSWTARIWAPTPDNISFGSTSVLVGDFLYVTRGYGDKAFYRYNIGENEWDILDDLPQPAHYGCDVAYDGDENLYFIFGGYSKKFYKYNIEDEDWTQLPDLLDTIYYGAGIEFDGTDLYIVRGQVATDFWKFDISENSWLNMAPTPLTVYRGGNLVYGNDGKMYVLRGYNRNTIWSYDIAGNTWDSLTNAPTTFYGEQKGVYYNGYIYFLRAYNTNGFYRYNISGDSWDTLENTPQNTRYSSLTYNSDDGNIYAIRGNGQYHLWKFDPEEGTSGEWVGPKNATATIGTGGDLIWNEITGAGAYVYTVRGNNSNAFYRYDIANNDWDTMANTLANMAYDTKGTYYNGNIYIPRGSNDGTFYRYNIAGDSWSTMAAAPGNLRYGSSAAYNSGDGFIYVTAGNGTDDFYQYDIAGDNWNSSVPDIVTSDGTSYRVYTGGRLESDGTDLYLMPGDGETAFLKYDVSEDEWIELTSSPFAQYYGTDMTYYNGKIYALTGYYKDESWEYDIAGNTWRQLPFNQDYTYGRGPYNGASLEYAGNSSFYATPGFGLSDMWSYTLGASNYLTSGVYTSDTVDLSHVSSWTSLTTTDDVPANTSIVYETRTSNDGEDWSDWEAISGTDIQSPTRRYIQVKITLGTTDGANTPTVYDFTVAYNSEDSAPTNPTSVNAYSQQVGGDALISETAYKHAHPYFSWTGASDGGSGVDGYYIYFGTDSGVDPAVSGIYQTEDTFSVNLAMSTGNYYLRIKTKDKDGNVSDSAWSAFTYNYSGVSPPLSEEKTEQADFESGTLENISATNEPGSLQLGAGDGFWNENRMSYAPAAIRYGGELVYVEDESKLYTFRGNNTLNFYSYDLTTDTWAVLANAPETVRMGGAVVKGPEGYLYGTRGNNTPTFWRYDIENDLWETMASAPKNFYYGGSLTYGGDRYIYGLPGNDDAFYRYDTQNNQWTSLTNAEFGNPNEGDGQRVYVGSDTVFDDTNAVYTLQGNYYPYFAKYSIDDNEERGETADTWTSLAQAPLGVYAGGSLAYDSTSNALYVLGGNWRQNFYKYDIASDVWSQLPQIPVSVEYGASLKVVNGYVYATRGNSTGFYRFNIDDNTWEVPHRGFFGPSTTSQSSYFGFYYGSEMAEDDEGNIYIVRGYHDNTFGKYNIQTGGFTELARTPIGIYNGAAMIYNEDENAVYLTCGDTRTRRSGNVNNYFMKYTIASNTWEIITADRAPYQTGYGSSMTYDGSRYIYLTRGANANTWWRYDTQALAGSRWSGALPTISGWTQGYGGRIVYKDGYIYSTRGQNTNTFWRYDVAGGSWTQMTNVPGNTYIGGSLADGYDGYLYATRGYNSDDYYRYSISGNSWEAIEDVPAQVYQGGASVSIGNRIWSTSGTGTNSYRDGLYSYVIGSEANDTGFEKTGTYTSESIDLLSVYRWANLTLNYTKPNNTNVIISTRSSEDESEWSAWDQASNEKDLGSDQYRYNIVSPADEYIQVKMEFSSSDQIFSPLIESYSVNYYQDIQAPSNPSSIDAYSASDKITSITTSTWYNHAAPYFEWPEDEIAGGATDGAGGSGVVGYYVYFGTNSGADPFVDGEYQTDISYTASNLTSGSNYYLLIKAIDDAGMIPAVTYQAFIYEFDNTTPTNPSDIMVDPAGYSASDNYAFTWNSDAADSDSGLEKFQYQTGSDEDTWYDITDTETVTISIPNAEHVEGAYQSGKNWFYLRTVDNAENVSEPLTQEYYFSQDAPSPPLNLTVTPDSSETNSFAFNWEQPESFMGSAAELSYHYSVNALPSAYNAIETPLTSAGPGPFATQKGSNRFYVCAMDEAGNINYDLYAHVDFYADTSAPGPPINIQIFDTSDRENQEYSIAIKWSPPVAMNEDNFDGYVIYRSDDDDAYTEVATTSGSAYVDTELESRLYYYYVKSKDSTNNISTASSTVSIIPTGRYTTPPTLVTEPSVTEQAYAVTVKWGTNRVASSFVEYGKSMSLGKTNGQVDSVTDHVVELSGLDAGEKHYYRAKYIDPDGNIGTSEIGTFETLPPPTISEVAATEIGLSTATVSWKTNTSATCTLKYGVGAFTSSIEETSSGGSHVLRLTGLDSSTIYKIQIDAIDDDLNEFSSDEYTFTTLEQPIVSDLVVENKENVDIPTVIVKYNTSLATTTLVKFKTDAEGSYSNYLTNDHVTEHSVEVEGMEPAIEYELIATGVDEHGIEAAPQDARITTRSDSRPPGVLTNRAVGKIIGRGKSAHANMYIKVETDEVTTAKVFYSMGIVLSNFEQSANEDSLNTYHLITIPVDPGQVYSYIIKIYDESKNETVTRPVTVVIEDSKESASEIVVNTFSDKFSWVTKLWE